MKLSRLLALLLVALMLFTLITGCRQQASQSSQTSDSSGKSSTTTTTPSTSGSTQQPKEEKKEIKTYTAFVNDPNVLSGNEWDTPIGKKITELTGVRLIVDRPVGADTRQKAGVLIASGDYPDIIWTGEASGEFLAAKALIPLDDLIEKYGENIKKSYRPSELNLLRQQYGVIYILGTVRAGESNLYPYAGFYIANDVLEKQGWPVVKTLSQFKEVIRNYVKENPTYDGQPVIGFSLSTEGGRVSSLQYGCPRYLAGYPNDGVTIIDPETLEAKVVLTQDFNIEYLKFMNEFWKEGLLDKEIFMQTNEQYHAKISTGRLISYYDQRWSIQNALNALEQAGITDRYPVAFPVVFDDVKIENYRGPRTYNTTNGMGISVKCKDPEGVMQFLDMMVSDEITTLVNWGIEGVDYSVKPDGTYYRTPEQWANTLNSEYAQNQGLNRFIYVPMKEGSSDPVYGKLANGNWVSPTMADDYYEYEYNDTEKEILKAYGISTFCDFFMPSYMAKYEAGWALRSKLPSDHPGKIAIERALEMSTQYITDIIMSKTEDEFWSIWNKYQEELSKLDLKTYEDAITELVRDGAKYYQN